MNRIRVSDQVLFPEPSVERVGPLGATEPAVHWFTKSTRPQAAIARSNVNTWYAQFPDPDRKMAARLKSRSKVAHVGALDELYIHHLLKRRYEDVRFEVGGVGPDFRMYEDGMPVGAVEVLSLFEPAEWTAESDRHGRIADAVNKRLKPSAGYFVELHIERAEHDPAFKRLTRFVELNLGRLPPLEQVLAALPHPASDTGLPSPLYAEDGVRIRLRFRPMSRPDAPSRTNPDARLAWIGNGIGGFVMCASRLRERIADKAGGRYKLDAVPFAIAVGVHDMSADSEEYVIALYGRDLSTSPTGNVLRSNDGLFGIDGSNPDGRNRRVSAVVAINNLLSWDPDAADIAVLGNPNAEHPWPGDATPATRRFGPIPGDQGMPRLGWT